VRGRERELNKLLPLDLKLGNRYPLLPSKRIRGAAALSRAPASGPFWNDRTGSCLTESTLLPRCLAAAYRSVSSAELPRARVARAATIKDGAHFMMGRSSVQAQEPGPTKRAPPILISRCISSIVHAMGRGWVWRPNLQPQRDEHGNPDRGESDLKIKRVQAPYRSRMVGVKKAEP
jgi:hypothetical protein